MNMDIEEAKEEIQELVDMLGSKQDREDLAIIYNFIKKQEAELMNKDKLIDKIIVEKIINFIDKQLRCYERKITKITEVKVNEKRCLSEKERREIKYYVGRKDECIKIKQFIEREGK